MWFNIIKGNPSNPKSLYSFDEIVEMYGKKENHTKTYDYYPIANIGNLKPLGDLRGDYSMFDTKLEYSAKAFNVEPYNMNYSIEEIEFILHFRIENDYNEGLEYLINIDIRVEIRSPFETVAYALINTADKMVYFEDFVEIYNQPNHKYKNINAEFGIRTDFPRTTKSENFVSRIIELIDKQKVEIDGVEYTMDDASRNNADDKNLLEKLYLLRRLNL